MLTSDFRMFCDKLKKNYFFILSYGLCCVGDIFDLCFVFGLMRI